MRATELETDEIRAYVEDQAHEEVVHLEKVASELVGPIRHDIWDVHGAASRWWVVTNPTNLYDQADFKSRDVVLTFHIGLMLRVQHAQERDVPVSPEVADLLPGSWRRWQQASRHTTPATRPRRFNRSVYDCVSAWFRLLARRGTTT